MASAIAVSMANPSCVAPKKSGIVAPTQTDRLIQAYPEIQNGRLLILADFEDEKQMSIFQLESATNPGRLARDPKKGRPETGIGALAVAFTAPNESVVIASPSQGDWFLKRDWRPYDLLMMAANSPVDGLSLEIKIIGGVSGQAVEARTETVLTAGWNLLRFDLVEIGEQVPLDDIQEVRLAVTNPPGQPATLYFDDILLSGNRRDLMGDSANPSGGLYVQNAGRHWNIGAGGRFEISFRNGQIARWFNLAADPYRLRNLVRGTSLGPMPVLVEGTDVRLATSANGAVNVRQSILEMNAVRVVIESIWQAEPGGKAGDSAAGEHWIYTIYPTGQIFVSARTAARQEGSQQTGMAVSMAWSPAAPLVQLIRSEGVQSAGSTSPSPVFAVVRSADSDSALLFIPYSDGDPVQLKEVADTAARTTSTIWSKARTGESSQTWRCQFLLSSMSTINEAESVARANDYTQPGSVRIEVGRPQKGPMLRSDGFHPGSGCFHVATEGNRARMVVEGKKRPVYSPAFQVDGGTTDQAWVYVNYLVHPSMIRGPRGEVVFQLPGPVTKEIVVEPLFKKLP